jgi:hypothetical protein
VARSLPTVALALLLVLAGCSAPASDGSGRDGRSVTVSLSNHHDRPYAVRIALASGALSGVRVTYENESSRTFDVPNVSALPPGAGANATDLEPLGAGLRSERFVLEPGGGVGTTFDDVPPVARLIYVLSVAGGNQSLRSTGTARCAATGARLDVSLSVGPDGGVEASTTCTTEGTSSGS